MYNLGNIKHFLGAFWPTQIDSKKECPCSLIKHEHLFSEFSVVCKTNIIWFGVGKCFQDHWKKIPILVYIILEVDMSSRFRSPKLFKLIKLAFDTNVYYLASITV